MEKKIKAHRDSLLVFVIALFYFVAPLESVAIFSQFSLPKLTAIIVIVVRVVSLKPIRVSKTIITFMPLLLYALLSLIWSIDIINTIRSIFLFLIPSLLVMEATDNSIVSEREIRIYLGAFALGAVVTVVMALFNRNQIISDATIVGQERLSALGQDQNTFAFLVNMLVVIILSYYRNTKNIVFKVLSILVLMASVFVIISTGSRTGLFVLAVIVSLFVFSSKGVASKTGFIVLLIIAVVILLPKIPTTIIDRYLESEELINEGDFSQRGIIWRRAWKCFFEENMFLGVGYSNFSEMLAKHYMGWKMASHNTYLTYLVEFGWIGVWTFVYVLYRIIKSAFRIKRKNGDIFIFGFIFPIFITMFLLETEYKRWLFMLVVLLFNYEKIKTSNHT